MRRSTGQPNPRRRKRLAAISTGAPEHPLQRRHPRRRTPDLATTLTDQHPSWSWTARTECRKHSAPCAYQALRDQHDITRTGSCRGVIADAVHRKIIAAAAVDDDVQRRDPDDGSEGVFRGVQGGGPDAFEQVTDLLLQATWTVMRCADVHPSDAGVLIGRRWVRLGSSAAGR